MDPTKVGFAMCGAFRTFHRVIPELEWLSTFCIVTPIMSKNAVSCDTRYYKAESLEKKIESCCGVKPISKLSGVENYFSDTPPDVLIVAPCTGNTASKIAAGIADTSVTLAVSRQLGRNKPVVIAPSLLEGLDTGLKTLGALWERKNLYFVPFTQVLEGENENCLLANMTLIDTTMQLALKGRQLQPMII